MKNQTNNLNSKIKKLIIIILISLIGTIILSNYTENISESFIRAVHKKTLGGRGGKEILDQSGVPIIVYGKVDGVRIGKKRNPVAVSAVALSYYKKYKNDDESFRKLFLNCADWIVNNATKYGDYSILEYEFPWLIYNMIPPWRSGMAQGMALQVLIRANDLTGNIKYLDCAESLLNSFFIEVKDGGVTYKTSENGWWYEEYADENGKKSMVLNGMMYALIGIFEYYEYTKNLNAKYLFEQGMISLKINLQNYDLNGYSYYDILGNPSGKYHKVHINQLRQLYNITNEIILKDFYNKWQTYQNLPLITRLIKNPSILGFAILALNFIILFLILVLTLLKI